jgi:hypothetical protein
MFCDYLQMAQGAVLQRPPQAAPIPLLMPANNPAMQLPFPVPFAAAGISGGVMHPVLGQPLHPLQRPVAAQPTVVLPVRPAALLPARRAVPAGAAQLGHVALQLQAPMRVRKMMLGLVNVA